MTDILNAEENVKEHQPLTVAKVIEDLSKFPQGSEFVAAIEGVGMTVAVVGAAAVTTVEGKELVVIQLDGQGVIRALQHAQQMAQQQEAAN